MVDFIDIHTHWMSIDAGITRIVTLDLDEEVPKRGIYSYGIHPWQLDSIDFQEENIFKTLEQRLQTENVVAIGEAGLDKMHEATFERQIAIFERQIDFSEYMQKPMILHVVKSNNEIVMLRKKHKAQQPWILHGFNGTEEDASQLNRQGIFVSVGNSLLYPDRRICKSLKFIDLDWLFLETDKNYVAIETVYEVAAQRLEMDLEALKAKLFSNFARIFK